MDKKPGKTPVVLHSFGELGASILNDQLDLSEDDLIELDEENLSARAQERRQNKARIQEWVPSRMAFLKKVARLSEEERELLQEKAVAVQEEMNILLAHTNPAYRRTAWLALLSFHLKSGLESQTEVEELITQLVEDKYLVRVEKEDSSTFKAYDRYFTVSDQAGFGNGEYQEIRRFIIDLISRANRAETHGDITWDELLASKPGAITVGVPPEQIKDDDGGLTPYWRPGCQLRIRSTGKVVTPVRVITTNNKLRDAIATAIEGKIHLFLESLGSPTPPFVRGHDRELSRKVQLLYHLLRRGLAAEGKRRLRQWFKKEMATRTTVSVTEFFLNGQPGICLVDLEQPWEHKDLSDNVVRTHYDVFFLVSRTCESEGEESVRQITFAPDDSAQVPQHLQEYLATCKGTYPEGEKFRGVPYPLRGMLQLAFGQAAKTVAMNGGNHSNG